MIRVTFTAGLAEVSVRVAVDDCARLCEQMESELAGAFMEAEKRNRNLAEGEQPRLFIGP